MAVAFEDFATSTSSTCSVPNVADGTLLIGFGFRNNATPGSVPTGWNLVDTVQRSGASMVTCWKFKSSGDSSADFTDCTATAIVAYSGADGTDPIGANLDADANGSSVTIPGLTLEVSDGSSWVVAAYGHRSTSQFPTPSGMTERLDLNDGAQGQLGVSDTGAGVSSFSGTSITVDAAANWVSTSVEIIAGDDGSVDAEVLVVTMTATGTMLTPTVIISAEVQAVTMTATGQMFAPLVTTGTNAVISVPLMTGSGQMLAPSVHTGAGVSVPLMTVIGQFLIPDAVGPANVTEIFVPVMRAEGTMLVPDVGAGTVITVPILRIRGKMFAPKVEFTWPEFEPPTYERRMPTDIAPLKYYHLDQGASVVRINGVLITIRTPGPELLTGEEGKDFFRGGHVYEITEAGVLEELIASGYEVRFPD